MIALRGNNDRGKMAYDNAYQLLKNKLTERKLKLSAMKIIFK